MHGRELPKKRSIHRLYTSEYRSCFEPKAPAAFGSIPNKSERTAFHDDDNPTPGTAAVSRSVTTDYTATGEGPASQMWVQIKNSPKVLYWERRLFWLFWLFWLFCLEWTNMEPRPQNAVI